MSLDAFVRCTCIRNGKVKKPHPFPGRLTFDDSGSPLLTGDPTEEEWEAHEQWVQDSCEHEGFLASEFLGNITRAQHVREFLRGLQGDPGPKFPILLKKSCTTEPIRGIGFPVKQTPALLREVTTVLASSDILTPGEKEFFDE